MKWLIRKIKWFFISLAYAMKRTNDGILTLSTTDDGNNVTIQREQHEIRLSKDLLAGKETQQVREIRYRTYLVDREAKKFEYFSPYLSKRRTAQKPVPKCCDTSDGLEVVVIQDNFPIVENVGEALDRIGTRGKRPKMWIDIQRSGMFTPRYRIEDFTKRVAVKRLPNEKAMIVEFYVSIYPDENKYTSKGFINEVKQLAKDPLRRNDIKDIQDITFVTSNAYGMDDLMVFHFRNPILRSVRVYGGDYILSFRAGVVVDGKDIVDDYREEAVDNAYKTHAPRAKWENLDTVIEENEKEYVCEGCGRKFTCSSEEIDSASPEDSLDGSLTAYRDLEITKATIGKALCSECLMKLVSTTKDVSWAEENQNGVEKE